MSANSLATGASLSYSRVQSTWLSNKQSYFGFFLASGNADYN